MNKTAVQELLDELQELEDNAISLSDVSLIRHIRGKAASKLSKEKEQTINFSYYFFYECYKKNGIILSTTAPEYYNQIFHQNK